LKDPCHSPKKETIFSDTVNPKFQSFSINNRSETKVQKFTINVIDTPGLFEVKASDAKEGSRTNEVISNTISKCLQNEITGIHAIVIFVTFEGGINPYDIEAMKVFLQMFGGSGVKISLCITRADVHSLSWRQDRIDDLMKHSVFKQLVEEEKMVILFMGVADSSRYESETQYQKTLKTVYNMRKAMLDFIFNATDRVKLTEMRVSKRKIDQVKAAVQIVTENFQSFSTVKDWDSQNVQERMTAHRDNVKYLEDHRAYLTISEMAGCYTSLVTALDSMERSLKHLDSKRYFDLAFPFRLPPDPIIKVDEK